MSQDNWNREWAANKWLIRGTAFLVNALLSVLIFLAVGIINNIESVKNEVVDVKNSNADILNRQIKMEVQQNVNNDKITSLEYEFKSFQKEYYMSQRK